MDTVASVPEDGEKIIEIQLERLRTFKNHPFKVRMDQEMIRLSASVEKYGIINPLIFRLTYKGITSMSMKQYTHYIVHADVALLKNNSY